MSRFLFGVSWEKMKVQNFDSNSNLSTFDNMIPRRALKTFEKS